MWCNQRREELVRLLVEEFYRREAARQHDLRISKRVALVLLSALALFLLALPGLFCLAVALHLVEI